MTNTDKYRRQNWKNAVVFNRSISVPVKKETTIYTNIRIVQPFKTSVEKIKEISLADAYLGAN